MGEKANFGIRIVYFDIYCLDAVVIGQDYSR